MTSNEWQPIATVPKDTVVLVWAKEWNTFGIFAAELSGEYGWWNPAGVTGFEWEASFGAPTHWMPLPAPPAETKAAP